MTQLKDRLALFSKFKELNLCWKILENFQMLSVAEFLNISSAHKGPHIPNFEKFVNCIGKKCNFTWLEFIHFIVLSKIFNRINPSRKFHYLGFVCLDFSGILSKVFLEFFKCLLGEISQMLILNAVYWNLNLREFYKAKKESFWNYRIHNTLSQIENSKNSKNKITHKVSNRKFKKFWKQDHTQGRKPSKHQNSSKILPSNKHKKFYIKVNFVKKLLFF